MCRHDCPARPLGVNQGGLSHTGGRGHAFRALEDTQKNAEREQAYVRATVARSGK